MILRPEADLFLLNLFILNFLFILAYSPWTMLWQFQVDGRGTQPYYMHVSILPQTPLPSETVKSVSTVQTMTLTTLQFSSVAQSCLTLCDPMNCSTPGLPIHHQLPELTQTHLTTLKSIAITCSILMRSIISCGHIQKFLFAYDS